MNVPIVGAPRVIEWRPIVTLVCSCGKGEPLLISGQDKAAVCRGCGSAYALAQLHYDRQANEDSADIGIMKVQPRPAVTSNGERPEP